MCQAMLGRNRERPLLRNPSPSLGFGASHGTGDWRSFSLSSSRLSYLRQGIHCGYSVPCLPGASGGGSGIQASLRDAVGGKAVEFGGRLFSMDIQWVILAQGCRLNLDGTLDIARIFHRFTIYDRQDTFPCVLIAKYNADPTEAGETKNLTIDLSQTKVGKLDTFRLAPWVVPSVKELMTSTRYITVDLELRLSEAGEYLLTVCIDGQPKNDEMIRVRVGREALE
jgi:hypothetical protein